MHQILISFFVDKCNLLSQNQYGFRAKHSTYMVLLNIIDQISAEMDSKKYSIDIFLDLSKAFDTINHNILLKKLEIYGIRGIALQWFSSYLSGRTQFVSVDSIVSNAAEIKCWVPQGPVLGPLLFIIYINDIVFIWQSKG